MSEAGAPAAKTNTSKAVDILFAFVIFPVIVTSPFWLAWMIWTFTNTQTELRAECESIGAVDMVRPKYGPFLCVMQDGSTVVPPSRVPGGDDE